ncbi:hypothetical protein EHO60_07055 [Leptospira fletcheri]|uniref:Porin n=1 Tax=Leptospira fletcheri TaxID=2484981 RepID=A0A4R9GIW2_9LEPT|nr:cell envelope integrity protein TolA [Leptospira fletcheri]TGK12023.1 hypothetical protein EHO60_07055 [Leptospira fletcheri]
MKPLVLKAAMLVFLLLPVSFLSAQQMQSVFLRDGRVLKGEVVDQTATSIQLKLPDGKVLELAKTSILRISFKDAPPPKQEKETKKTEPTPEEQDAAKKLEEEKAAKLLAEQAKKDALAEEKKARQAKRQKEIDEAKRNSLELYAGTGMGSFQYQTEDYYEKFLNFVNLTKGASSGGQFFSSPQTKAQRPLTVSARYSWNRLVLEAGGSNFRNNASMVVPGTINTSGAVVPNQSSLAFSSFPETYKQLYAQVSFSVYPHPKYDVRPILGYQRIWQKADNSFLLDLSPAVPGGYNVARKEDRAVADYLHGPSFGMAFDMKINEKLEARFEVQSYSLKGDSQANLSTYGLTIGGNPGGDETSRILNHWNAKGSFLSAKLIYEWKYGLRFWVGFQSTKIQYSLQSTRAEIGTTNPTPPDQLFLQQIVINSIAQSYAGATSTSAIFLGVGTAFDFKK